MTQVDLVVDVLGGPTVLGSDVSTAAELRALTREGLPFAVVERVTKALEVNASKLSAFMAVSERTLARRTQSKTRLRPEESDRIVRLARIFARAKQVFGSAGKASRWLSRPNRALGLEIPLSFLDTDVGTQEVEAVLGRIEDGVYS